MIPLVRCTVFLAIPIDEYTKPATRLIIDKKVKLNIVSRSYLNLLRPQQVSLLVATDLEIIW